MWVKKFKKKKRMEKNAKAYFENPTNNKKPRIRIPRKVRRAPLKIEEVNIDDLVSAESEGDVNNVKEDSSLEEKTESDECSTTV